MYICKTSIVIRISGNLAAIFDFDHTSTSLEIESTTTRKFDPENIGVAVGILSLCALELDISYMPGGHFTPTSLPANVAKKRCREKG